MKQKMRKIKVAPSAERPMPMTAVCPICEGDAAGGGVDCIRCDSSGRVLTSRGLAVHVGWGPTFKMDYPKGSPMRGPRKD